MGGAGGTQTQNAAGPFFGVAFVALVAVAVVGIGGLVYFFVFPEIRTNLAAMKPPTVVSSMTGNVGGQVSGVSPYESVLKTLTADERKVIGVLKAHEGKYLQKYIRSEAGLSRLQTHRIVARLADRGIVSLEKTGNTNNVLISDWLK